MRFIGENIVIPDKDLYPIYRLSPFFTSDMKINSEARDNSEIIDFLKARHNNKRIFITYNGRYAINLALQSLNLSKNDCVTIFTTSGNKYISSCVTNEIDKFCSWSRKFEKNTKAILLNHEFGYMFENYGKLKSYGVPVIEDVAYSFNSYVKERLHNEIGDYVVYSFPKFFPVQFGGALVTSNRYKIDNQTPVAVQKYVIKSVSQYVKEIHNFSEKRIQNYQIFLRYFGQKNIDPFFPQLNKNIPGVFLFKFNFKVNLDELKKFYWQNGVQCSVFYGENAFFLPIHHRINEFDIAYFYDLLKYFLKNN